MENLAHFVLVVPFLAIVLAIVLDLVMRLASGPLAFEPAASSRVQSWERSQEAWRALRLARPMYGPEATRLVSLAIDTRCERERTLALLEASLIAGMAPRPRESSPEVKRPSIGARPEVSPSPVLVSRVVPIGDRPSFDLTSYIA